MCVIFESLYFRFIEADGVRALINVMSSYPTSVKIQRQGCWALLTLAGSDEGARAVSNAGGAAAIMVAMMAHKLVLNKYI